MADQTRVLDAIAAVVAQRGVDVVVVPGDVYDRSIPSADAVAVCNRGFEAIRAAGAVIVATSGNHDSPVRLGAGAAFAAAGGLHLMTRCRRSTSRSCSTTTTSGRVLRHPVPRARDHTRTELGVPQARSHAEILDVAMARIRADLDERRRAGAPGLRSVLLAHAFVVGGEAHGSERSISVGGVETVSAFGVRRGRLRRARATCTRRRHSRRRRPLQRIAPTVFVRRAFPSQGGLAGGRRRGRSRDGRAARSAGGARAQPGQGDPRRC
ncbi:exonuclease subunit SbcD [Rhodococcus hoagii]|nr:exonuclease subunit SbcD [Prescottella equi]